MPRTLLIQGPVGWLYERAVTQTGARLLRVGTAEGCTVEDHSLVGSNSVVLHGAVVRTGSLVGASALVPGGMEVPSGTKLHVSVIGAPAAPGQRLPSMLYRSMASCVARSTASIICSLGGWSRSKQALADSPHAGGKRPDGLYSARGAKTGSAWAKAAAPAESPDAQGGHVDVQLSAFLTADGQRIDRGLVWRVYADAALPEGKAKLVATNRDATPSIKLAPGPYIVNVSFGRANLTRKLVIESKDGAPQAERFVINAGGLRVNATISGKPAPDGAVAYNIYSDRDQSDNRRLILSGAKPGLIVRLNSGIYHIESSYGDANAVVQSDVTVEAGKLTEATVAHAAAKVTLKLVTRAGGEALAGTAWTIQTPTGEVVKTSMGALPTHTLAPGTYIAVAKARNKAFSREFSVKDGDAAQVEVIIP